MPTIWVVAKAKMGFSKLSDKKIKEDKEGVHKSMPTNYLGVKYHHADDLADMLGVSIKTIYAYLKAGKIRGIKTLHKWWILEEDATDFLKKLEGQGIKPAPCRPGQRRA